MTSEAPAAERPGLVRALGPGMAIAVVVGNVIGSGIFAKPSQIATNAGDFRMIITAWIAGGLFCLLGALCFAELAAMLPRAGGLYVFLREAYGKPVAFLFGINEYLFGRPASIAALAVFFASLVTSQMEVQAGWAGELAISSAVIGGLALINVWGVIWGGRMQGLTTLIKAGFLGLFALLPWFFAPSSYGALHLSNYATTVPPSIPGVGAQFAAVLLAVMWAYNGWHDIAPVAEEVRDPQRNIPLSLIGGVTILIVLYVGANIAYHGVLTMSEVAHAGRDSAKLTMLAVLRPFGESVAIMGSSVIQLVILCSLFGATNANLMLGPRIAFAMARDGIFWRRLAFVHPRYHTPSSSIIVQAWASVGLIVLVSLLIRWVPALKNKNLFDLLTDVVVYSANVFYALCVLAVIVLRKTHPEWDRPYRTWGYPVVPILFLAGQIWFSIQVFEARPIESTIGVLVTLGGLPVYYLCGFHRSQPPAEPVIQ